MKQALFFRREESSAFHSIERKKIDVAEQTVTEVRERFEVFIGIIDTIEKKIFDGHTTIGILDIRDERFLQFIERLILEMRH